MSWLLIVPCVLIVCVVWFPLLALILRPWVLVFPFSNKMGTTPELPHVSRTKYILVAGVLQWGWACFMGNTLRDYLGFRYWGETSGALSAQRLFVSFIIWSVAGISFGWMMGNLSQGIARDSKPDSSLR